MTNQPQPLPTAGQRVIWTTAEGGTDSGIYNGSVRGWLSYRHGFVNYTPSRWEPDDMEHPYMAQKEGDA